MMTPEQATKAVSDLVQAEVKIMKQMNTPRGIGKTAAAQEERAAIKIFQALTGLFPTEEQINQMLGG